MAPPPTQRLKDVSVLFSVHLQRPEQARALWTDGMMHGAGVPGRGRRFSAPPPGCVTSALFLDLSEPGAS